MYDYSKLYLQLEANAAAHELIGRLDRGASLPAVLFEPSPGQPTDLDLLSRLVQAVQAIDAATLIKDDIELATACHADGVHLSFTSEQLAKYSEAKERLGPDGIVGMSAGFSRHNAMVAGEAGADYVAFEDDKQRTPESCDEDSQLDLLAWWAELFEIPCVALDVTTPDRCLQLAMAGADFVGQKLGPDNSASELEEQMQAFARKLVVPAEQVAADE